MKIFLQKAILINRAPFEKIELDFNENEISVLTAINGKGKTTILSYIVDSFYEMVRPFYPNEFENKEYKFYRVSSSLYNININKPSFVYLRFKTNDKIIDYLDVREKCTEDQYNEDVIIENKIPFNDFSSFLDKSSFVKKVSSNFQEQDAKNIFSNNILTYFPSYRYETPGYLNEPYKINLKFKKLSNFSGYLINPIEVITSLSQLANWIMDVILDIRERQNQQDLDLILKMNLDTIITNTLISKRLGELRFGLGKRNMGGTRIQILQNIEKGKTIYPSIFDLSSGESSILCLFGELLRQADYIKESMLLEQITGIAIIDEIEKHLHIKLQKEVLPKLFNLFPNVQFIISSHSPFLSIGLAELSTERSKILDLDNFGISSDPTSNELYTEVYNMMVSENDNFKDMYLNLEQKIKESNTPLMITEGKTDIKHIKKAKEKLNIVDCDIEYYEVSEDWGDSKLNLLLEQLSKVKHHRKIIGIFDRDVRSVVQDIEKGEQSYKNYGNNVFGFCIPVPVGRDNYNNISIEFYYSDEEIKKEKDGRRLYFDNEIDYLFNKSLNVPEYRKLENPRIENENIKKIFDEKKICEVTKWMHSKSKFASLIETDEDFTGDFNFSNFNLIFNKLKLIITQEQII